MPSPGVAPFPRYCLNNCPLSRISHGFLLDWVPADARLAVMLAYPSDNDIIEREPFGGIVGSFWFNRLFGSLGLRREEVAVCFLLRCFPPKSSSPDQDRYPSGHEARVAEAACRHWDGMDSLNTGGLISWLPELFLVTFDMRRIVQIPAFERIIKIDLENALKLSEMFSKRPLVLMGEHPLRVIAPWTKGSVKRWRGHWWIGQYPFGWTGFQSVAGEAKILYSRRK